MANIHVRPADISDLDDLLTLLPQMSRDPQSASGVMPDGQLAHERFEQIEQSGQTILVAEDLDTQDVLGTCTLLILPAFVYGGRSFAQIEHMVVARAHRGKGIGSALMTYAFDEARKNQCYKIQLLTGTLDEQVGFYKKQGFTGDKTTGFKMYLFEK